MTDRVPNYPGRVKLVPVSGQTNTYDMTMADDPSQVGTALNKANLLTDATAALIAAIAGTTPDTPNEALAGLANGALAFEAVDYTGDGTNTKTITFTHKPDLVYILRTSSYGTGEYVWLTSFITSSAASNGGASAYSAALTDTYVLTTTWSDNQLTIVPPSVNASRGFNYPSVNYRAIGIRLGASA